MILLMEPSQKDDLLEAFEQGADDYLVKPFDGYELRAKLLVAKRILGLQDRLIAMRDELQVQATHDALTGLWNRRASMAALDRELVRAARENKTVGLMLADLDHFKHINDTYGHLAGDKVLQAVAAKLKGAHASLRHRRPLRRRGIPGDFAGMRRGARSCAAPSTCAPPSPASRWRPRRETSPSRSAWARRWPPGPLRRTSSSKSADEALYRAKRGRPEPRRAGAVGSCGYLRCPALVDRFFLRRLFDGAGLPTGLLVWIRTS